MSAITIEPSLEPNSRPATPAARSAGLGVLVVADEAWLRTRMCRLLEDESWLGMTAALGTPEQALSMAEREAVDVIVIGHRSRSHSSLWLCQELKRVATPPAVVICSACPDAVLTACCVVVEADALVSVYDCDAELAGTLEQVAHGIRLLPSVPPRVGAMLHERLSPAEHAIFGMLLAGLPGSDVARGLRLSRAELESQRSTLLDKLETLPLTSGRRY